jgi:hypothetical protein
MQKRRYRDWLDSAAEKAHVEYFGEHLSYNERMALDNTREIPTEENYFLTKADIEGLHGFYMETDNYDSGSRYNPDNPAPNKVDTARSALKLIGPGADDFVKVAGDTMTGSLGIQNQEALKLLNPDSSLAGKLVIGSDGIELIETDSKGADRSAFTIRNDGEILINGHKIWNEDNDGDGSGLDADMIDGHQWSEIENHKHYNLYQPDLTNPFVYTDNDEMLHIDGNLIVNTNGIGALMSTYKGGDARGENIFIGGGGQSSIGINPNPYNGSYNVSLGIDSLLELTTGRENVAIGYLSLKNNTEGNWNSALGSYALLDNTTGYYDTAIGNLSLSHNTTGYNNTAVGAYSLAKNEDGNNNTAIGLNSLHNNVSGSDLVAIGAEALYSNTTGYENTAVGYQSLYNNTTGYSNVAIGERALKSNTSGAYDIAIGPGTLQNSTSSFKNTAIGSFALLKETNGQNNIAIGVEALQNDIGGKNNIAIGVDALFYVNGTNSNIGIGYFSGRNANGSKGIYIGEYSITGEDNAVNEIAIGYHVVAGGSNTVVLGNDNIGKTYLKGIVNFNSPDGTSPMNVLSKTLVNNLNVEYLGGYKFEEIPSVSTLDGFVSETERKNITETDTILSAFGKLDFNSNATAGIYSRSSIVEDFVTAVQIDSGELESLTAVDEEFSDVSNKGVAVFNANDFDVTNGVVSLPVQLKEGTYNQVTVNEKGIIIDGATTVEKVTFSPLSDDMVKGLPNNSLFMSDREPGVLRIKVDDATYTKITVDSDNLSSNWTS